MDKRHWHVFVSSTSKDLVHHRTKVRDAIVQRGLQPVMMEDFTAISQAAMDACLAAVDSADVFVGLYAYRYGYCPEGSQVSMTELEYQRAKAKDKPRLIFIVDDSATFSEDHPIRQYADHDPRLKGFLDKIEKEIVRKTFTTPEDLALKVSQSLERWEEQPLRASLPLRVRAIALLLAVVTGLLAFDTVWTLFRAGQTAFGAAAAFVGLVMALLPLWATSLKLVRDTLEDLPLPAWLPVLLIQSILLVATLVGRPALYSTLATQQISAGLQASDEPAALAAFDSASILGGDPKSAVRLELDKAASAPDLLGEARLVTLARLYVQLGATDPDRAAVSERFAQLTNQSIESQMTDRATKFAGALAVLDKKRAVTLADASNDAAVILMNSEPPQFTRAQVHLEVVRTLDKLIEGERSVTKKSVARYNLGYLYEERSDFDTATNLYREAITLDEGNLEARYALSSLLYIYRSGDTKALDEAISVANMGWKIHIPPENCRGPQNLSDDDTFIRSWHCFILMTTEAGARRVRNNANLGDIPSVRRQLVESAIALAEANGQFATRGMFAAEAYYELYELTKPNADMPTLCAIIRYHDPYKPRHRAWVQTANEALAGRQCGP